MELNWKTSFINAFMFTGAILFLMALFTTGGLSLGGYISGYACFLISILVIITLMFNQFLMNAPNNEMTSNLMGSMIYASGPFLITAGLFSFMLYMVIFYMERIKTENVSPGFYTFNTIIVLLSFIQFYFLYTASNDKMRMSKVTTNIMYLIGVFMGICAGIVYIILKYYSTDGFTTGSCSSCSLV